MFLLPKRVVETGLFDRLKITGSISCSRTSFKTVLPAKASLRYKRLWIVEWVMKLVLVFFRNYMVVTATPAHWATAVPVAKVRKMKPGLTRANNLFDNRMLPKFIERLFFDFLRRNIACRRAELPI